MKSCALFAKVPCLTLAALTAVCLLSTPHLAGASWVDLGGEAVTVELLDYDGARSVVEITIGGFDAREVVIDGRTSYPRLSR